MNHSKKILSLLLAVLMLTTTLFTTGCNVNDLVNGILAGITQTTPEETTPEVITPDTTTPEATTPDTPDVPDAPDVFEGIEFSDPAVVIPAAYALAKGASLEGTYTLKGKIIETGSYNAADKDMHVTIVVDGYEDYPLYCYFLKNCTPEVSVGDYVAVQGIIKNYNGTIEFERPNMIAHEDVIVPPSGDEDDSSYDDIQTDDPAVVLPKAYALASGAYLDGTYTLKGQIISASYNSQYGDISLTFVIEGFEDYPMYCYQIKKDADKLGLGDYIAVRGPIMNYKGKIETLGLVSGDDASLNYVQIPTATTQFAEGKFTEADYAALVKAIFDKTIVVSNDIGAMPAVTNTTIDDQGNLK